MMKKLSAFLLLGLTVAFASCGDEKTEDDSRWFLAPQAAVGGTTVEMTCQTRFGEGVLDGVGVGFTYAPIVDGKIGPFADSADCRVDGNTLSSTLDGLLPQTFYVVYAFADFPSGRMQSPAASFETGKDELPEPDPDKPAFGTPSASAVTETTATLTCGFTFEGTGYKVYFRYKPSSASGYSQQEVSAGTGTKTASLTGLTAGTNYEFQLCADWKGQTYASTAGTFTTARNGGGSGDTKYSGWPELVPEDKSNSDYHYAYHICPDFSIGGHKARNYTVCFSAKHHCPVWVAAPRHDCYQKNSGRTNAYRADPDISADIQYKSKSTGGGCNKGHMLGSAERETTSAVNRQVFYYTNIAPQYSSGYNTGGGGWNTLEDWIDGKVCRDTTYLVIGTYFESYTDGYGMSASPKKISFGGRNDVSCPTMFYIAALRTKRGDTGKSVLNCSADELMCVAFVRSHNNGLKGQKVTSREMMSISDLEKLTGHAFFTNVSNAPKNTYNPSDWGL